MATNKHSITEKSALVVDDSKLARFVLKEMLLGHGIRVETAESAEEALGTLSVANPDVIFMDHMMPGMDGFQAVQAIKNDPKTATIPIVMYTSKEDGVYVSQARALGAVGVIPKKLKPVQLEKVLVQLNLIAEKPVEPELAPEPIDIPEPTAATRAAAQSSLEELAMSASEDLEKDSMRALFRQLFNEQRDAIKQDQNSLLEKTQSAFLEKVLPVLQEGQKQSRFHHRAGYIVAAVMLALIALPIYELYQRAPVDPQILNQQFAQQSAQISALKNQLANLERPVAAAGTQVVDGFDVETFEWAINQNTQLAYQQSLNTPHNMDYLNDLVEQLALNQYKGMLVVKYHAGEFCETLAETGERSLAVTNSKLSDCQRIPFDVLNTTQLGIEEFGRFLSVISLYQPDIDVRFESLGTAFTLVDYPNTAFAPSAGEWNRAARLNNRLEFELIPANANETATVNFAPVVEK